MTDSTDATVTTARQSHVSRLAQIMERMGFAIMGALCGFFVAAFVAKADIEEINSLGVLFSVILYGSAGFYLGTNLPTLANGSSVSMTRPLALASATGTFLTAALALVSVYLIVFDEVLSVSWTTGIGFCWTLGVLLQLAAGTAARLERITGGTG
jgi:hypothetical protein